MRLCLSTQEWPLLILNWQTSTYWWKYLMLGWLVCVFVFYIDAFCTQETDTSKNNYTFKESTVFMRTCPPHHTIISVQFATWTSPHMSKPKMFESDQMITYSQKYSLQVILYFSDAPITLKPVQINQNAYKNVNLMEDVIIQRFKTCPSKASIKESYPFSLCSPDKHSCVPRIFHENQNSTACPQPERTAATNSPFALDFVLPAQPAVSAVHCLPEIDQL